MKLKLAFATASVLLASLTTAALVRGMQDEKDSGPKIAPRTEQHALLERRAGCWITTLSLPGMPKVSQGSFEARMAMNDLWLVGDYRGDFMGTDFIGHEVAGYDAAKKKYVSVWTDSWTDGLTLVEGDYDAAKQTLTMWADKRDAAKGTTVRERHETLFIDANHWRFTMSHPQADGSYAAIMTIDYERCPEATR